MPDSPATTAVDRADSAPTAAELVCLLPAESRLKVIGLGGVGSLLIEPLAVFLRSLQRPLRLVLIDGDDFEAHNSQRVKFASLGNKAEIKAQELSPLLTGSGVGVIAVPEYVGPDNLSRLIRNGDVVFLCVDNHPTRRIVSDHCERLADVALFSGGNDGVEPPDRRGTYGNVQVHWREAARDRTLPITRLHPEIRHAHGKLPGGPDCAQLAASRPQILTANLAVASHLLNAFFAWSCGALTYQEVQFDVLEGRAVTCCPLPQPVGLGSEEHQR